MQIGNIVLKQKRPVILAPMSGITDVPFRNVVENFGASLLVSEMIASMAMTLQTHQAIKKSKISQQSEIITCVQIAGKDPEIIASAAKMNEDAGVRIIDLNFGCPAKQVVGGYAGCAIMKDATLAKNIIRATVRAVKVPVTVKMRLGWDEGSKNALEIAKIAQEEGAQMITVHGRTRAQFYSGSADWDAIGQIARHIDVPVIANGDINSPQKAVMCLERSAAKGVMIGRGCYGKPWLIQQVMHFLETGEEIPPPPLTAQLSTVLEHYDATLAFYGSECGVKMFRKHIGWYTSGMSHSAEFRAKINSMMDATQVRSSIEDFYDNVMQHMAL
ncbi:tRNA-dihydrouridine synthase B [Rickettsiales endosymbiont of Paramecium tredecaurelia]|uniref:tRNA dihydrouridine synthase DusB n=1 Tax=Candidatus Sarmatiella mevalonica TaxID=2770581 RepID=UPI001921CA5C|nr:tRNA dihydrouridine synthase DusB [Candidatus Sarmatiella mevalonica]MBL3284849.1 tRNA-dihydrouridine synthase B [Candidatus Sarmatiella mevalonica]